MRSMVRFLLVGVLLCVLFQVGEARPAYADDDTWVPGMYQGFVELTARHSVVGSGSTHSYKLEVIWETQGILDLELINNDTALLTVRWNELPVNIQQKAWSHFSTQGQDCTWSDTIKGEGGFTVLYLPPLGRPGDNFNAGYFNLPMSWNKNTTWTGFEGEAHGSIPDCDNHWGDGLAEVQQQIAVDELSQQIKELSFLTISFGPDMIGGACFLPGWEGGFTIKDGTVEHTVPKCRWRVFKPGSKEWQEWGK